MADAEHTAPKKRADVLRENAFRPGQSGNPAGRPKGARSKLGEAFLEALHADFVKHGVEAIKTTREEKPDQYLKVVASLLPKEIEAGERTIDAIGELLARIDGQTRAIVPTESRETAH